MRYSKTPLVRPPSGLEKCGLIDRMVSQYLYQIIEYTKWACKNSGFISGVVRMRGFTVMSTAPIHHSINKS